MKTAEPSIADFDELLAWLPILYAEGFKPVSEQGGGRNEKGEFVMPWIAYASATSEFFHLVAKDCWRDSEYLDKNVGELLADPQRVATASLAEIRSMLTWCARGERYSEGHWAAVINDGRIRNVLLRLQELKSRAED